MGMIDPKKIPPTPGQVAALEEAKKTGSITNPAGFQAMIEAWQAQHSGTQDNSAVRQVVKLTSEQRLAEQVTALAEQVAELRAELSQLRQEK